MNGTGSGHDVGWLMNNFVEQTAGISHAIVVSADGLMMGSSDQLPPERAEQLAAITAGTVSLTYGVARNCDSARVVQTIIEMEAGYMFLVSISDGSCIAVLAARGCDVGQVGYEITLLVDRVGRVLSAPPRGTAAAGVPVAS